MNGIVRKARPQDLDKVMELLNRRIQWLERNGNPQWNGRNFRDAMKELIRQGFTWLAYQGSKPVGTVTLSTLPDEDFWNSVERGEAALYMSKMATDPDFAGQGLGRELLYWSYLHACASGLPRLRWDAWRSNPALTRYYTNLGATHLRTEDPAHRQSGALFELAWLAVDTGFQTDEQHTLLRLSGQHHTDQLPDEEAVRVGAAELPYRIHTMDTFLCPPLYVERTTISQPLTTGCSSSPEPVSYVTLFHNNDEWRARGGFTHAVSHWDQLADLQKGHPYQIVHLPASGSTETLHCGLYLQSLA